MGAGRFHLAGAAVRQAVWTRQRCGHPGPMLHRHHTTPSLVECILTCRKCVIHALRLGPCVITRVHAICGECMCLLLAGPPATTTRLASSHFFPDGIACTTVNGECDFEWPSSWSDLIYRRWYGSRSGQMGLDRVWGGGRCGRAWRCRGRAWGVGVDRIRYEVLWRADCVELYTFLATRCCTVPDHVLDCESTHARRSASCITHKNPHGEC